VKGFISLHATKQPFSSSCGFRNHSQASSNRVTTFRTSDLLPIPSELSGHARIKLRVEKAEELKKQIPFVGHVRVSNSIPLKDETSLNFFTQMIEILNSKVKPFPSVHMEEANKTVHQQ